MTHNGKSPPGGRSDRRTLYLGAGLAIPFAALVWIMLIGALLARL